MLYSEEMKKKALNECINMIGEDLVSKHKDLCCVTYGIRNNKILEYSLGLDTEVSEYKPGGETPMKYYAMIEMDIDTGEITRDYENSVLPVEK